MTTDHASVLTAHIQEHAARYFPGCNAGQMSVQMIAEQKRPSAILYRFKVTDAVETHFIIIKVPARGVLKDQVNQLDFAKPLLFPKADSEEMHLLHYTALMAIHYYLSGLNRKELGSIRVLDYLPDFQAIIMEESSDRNLRDLVLKESRLRTSSTQMKLLPVFRNVGMWLRVYHTMPKTEQVQVRHDHREEFIEGILKLTGFLTERLGDKSFFESLASTLTHQVHKILPEHLPLGLGHGDYALRNILVSPTERVTVLDTFAKWRTPIYEDIGYFLTGLKMTSEQVASYGLVFSQGQLQEYEDAFLQGYFEQKPIPYPAIRLFEMLALLDKWSSVVISSYRRSSKVVGNMKATFASLYFKSKTKHLLKEITRVERMAASMGPERSY